MFILDIQGVNPQGPTEAKRPPALAEKPTPRS